MFYKSGRSSGVEHNLAKVGVEGSNPFARSILWTNFDGGIAQMVEHLLCKQGVIGSIPFASTKTQNYKYIMNKEELIKKLQYRSLNRGCKELDIIIGEFSNAYIHNMNMEQLLEYQEILDMNDNLFYSYIIEAVQNDSQNQDINIVMQKIIHFVKTKFDK